MSLHTTTATRNERHLETMASVGLALLLAVAGGIFFFKFGAWEPNEASKFWHYGLAWVVLIYLALQLIALLSTAIDSSSIGFGDTICSILPALVGALLFFEYLQGIIKLSTFSQNALLLMIGTSALDSLITLWVRFTVNRRTIGLGT